MQAERDESDAAQRTEGDARAPGWVWALCGWVLACAALEAGGRGAAHPGAAPADLSEDAARLLAEAAPRELRRLPGIGPTRALAIADHRWEHGPPPAPQALEAIPGIGPITAARVAAWLAAREAAQAPRPPPAQTAFGE